MYPDRSIVQRFTVFLGAALFALPAAARPPAEESSGTALPDSQSVEAERKAEDEEAPRAGEEEKQDAGETSPELQDLLDEFEEEENATGPKKPDYSDPKYGYLKMGTASSYLKRERFRLRDQILTFIPPLYQPAFLGHAYVLPPNAWRVSFTGTFLEVDHNDWFKGGEPDVAFENHRASRSRADLDIFYGMDRDFTIRLNIPFLSSETKGPIHPAGVLNMDLFLEGTSTQMGDISVFLKKKFWDQANIGFNLAGAVGIKFPNASDDDGFDRPLLIRDPMGTLGVAFGGGGFPRFADDGRLPSGLQPGTGGFGYILGLFGTRQFTRPRAAAHAGLLARFLDSHDGVEPGDELRFFATYVKPVYKDYISLELAVNGMHKDPDEYEGQFTHPVPDPVTGLFAGVATTPRPSFRKGTVLFASPSILFTPSPWLRFSVSGMFRLNEPELGPWPDSQLVLNSIITF
ncbi:MAG: hypothetical protein ACE5HD_06135 [Acidobacteriota bacterium]